MIQVRFKVEGIEWRVIDDSNIRVNMIVPDVDTGSLKRLGMVYRCDGWARLTERQRAKRLRRWILELLEHELDETIMVDGSHLNRPHEAQGASHVQ